MIATGVDELIGVIGTRDACAAMGLPRASHYRRSRGPRHGPPRPRPAPPRTLSEPERTAVLRELHSERFLDAAPAAVYATLLDEGTYLASQRTMYRILAAATEVRERRDQLRHPIYAKPELLATGPRQLMSWDISKLRGPRKWIYYHLYVILDVFSRYVPGWMVAACESAVLAERLIEETAAKEGIEPGQLTLHADRGTSMRSKPVALLLADLGIEQSHSRPHVCQRQPVQ
jgi:putative transposase